MKRSSDRILTTHVGSLIRPPALQDFLRAKQAGKPYDKSAYETCLQQSVADVVHKQAEVGIDVVSDGEFGKSISWSQYVLERLSGFERRPIKPGAIRSRAASTASISPSSTPSSMRARVSRPRSKRSASGRSAIPGRPSWRATSPISRRRSKTQRSKKRSCRWPRRRASFRIARTNITRAKRN